MSICIIKKMCFTIYAIPAHAPAPKPAPDCKWTYLMDNYAREKTSAVRQRETQNLKSAVAERAQRAANRKNTCKLRKRLPQFDNTHAANTHNRNSKKRAANKIDLVVLWVFAVCFFICVVSIFTICCQTDENVFLICWCFFYLHVFSEVVARWALSATIKKPKMKPVNLDGLGSYSCENVLAADVNNMFYHLRIKSQLIADSRPADPQRNMNKAIFSLKKPEVLSSRVYL